MGIKQEKANGYLYSSSGPRPSVSHCPRPSPTLSAPLLQWLQHTWVVSCGLQVWTLALPAAASTAFETGRHGNQENLVWKKRELCLRSFKNEVSLLGSWVRWWPVQSAPALAEVQSPLHFHVSLSPVGSSWLLSSAGGFVSRLTHGLKPAGFPQPESKCLGCRD